jgi:8-oxo-dGTP diphosphatase
MDEKRIIDVVGAIIKDGDRYLVGQRAANKAQGGLWEFMGGKIEPGETPEQALARECREELALEIEDEHIIDSVVHEYPEKTIRLTLISCSPKSGSIPKALEHQQIRWVTRAEMDIMDFAPADRELIQKQFSKKCRPTMKL